MYDKLPLESPEMSELHKSTHFFVVILPFVKTSGEEYTKINDLR